jgi:iron complex transport system permease protein
MRRQALIFTAAAALLVLTFFISVSAGSIKVTPAELIRGLFVEYDPDVATIYDLRLPRIFISMIAGAALAASGVLLQAVMKNPVADPGIIGISGGAAFFSVIVTAFVPSLFFLTPLIAFLGGVFAFILVYSLAWHAGLNPLRIILVGVAISAMFSGLSGALNSFSGGNLSGVAAIVNGNITMKTWDDVKTLTAYAAVGLVLALVAAGRCNLLTLDDKTVRSLGVDATKNRLAVSCVAVLLAGVTTAVIGSIGFLGLIAPHIARLIVGSDHRASLPFSMLLGAFVLLAADTAGRTIAAPYEIPAGILMAVVGGPFFVFLLKRSKDGYVS